MFLIYINYIGVGWENKHIYEFIFSDRRDGIDGSGWDEYPALGNPEPPNESVVSVVVRVELDNIKLAHIQYSSVFAYWDAVDGVVAIGWEDIYDYEEYPKKRLKFFFGDTFDAVKDALYERDIIMDIKYNKNNVTI